MKRRTADRAATADPPQFHAPDRIGKRRSKTPEGFLLCEDVPLARTGWMVYGPGETGVKSTNDSGLVMVHRSAESLFHPTTMASFNGKAVTDDHPSGGDVNASNWKEHARGSVHNVRRGEGEDADTLRGDLLITDHDTIKKVEAGKVEVSAGYDANYETTGPGEGRQHNIIGNHVALVDKGRCGPRCAIGDSKFTQSQPRTTTMSGKARRTVTEAVRKLFTDASEAAVGLLEPAPMMDGNNEEDDDDAGGTHVHVHMHGAGDPAATGPVGAGQTGGADDAAAAGEASAEGDDPAANADPVEARFTAIEATLQKILVKLGEGGAGDDDGDGGDESDGGDPTEDEATEVNPFVKKDETAVTKTGDSAALATSFQKLVADCEVLVPGFKTPTMDSKAKRQKTVDSMCATRRKALDAFNATGEGATLLTQVAGGKTIDVAGMPCAGAALLFNGAVAIRKATNNGRTTDGAGRLPVAGDGTTRKSTTLTIHEINELNRKKYPV